MKIVIDITTFEGNRIVLSPTGQWSDTIEDHSFWNYIPTLKEIKKVYGKGWEYTTQVVIWNWGTEDCEVIKTYKSTN